MITAMSRVEGKSPVRNHPYTHVLTFVRDGVPDAPDGVAFCAPFLALMDAAAAAQLEIGDLVRITMDKVVGVESSGDGAR